MVGVNDIVITGLGCVTPLGIGCDDFAASLLGGRCGIELLHQDSYSTGNTKGAATDATRFYGAAIADFDPKKYVTPRKALKVMSREVQISYTAAKLAWQAANLVDEDLDNDRVGVVYGSEMIIGEVGDIVPAVRACTDDGVMQHARWGSEFAKHVHPLWMLCNLPNMPACHVGIAIDARGPNNTIAQEEVSGLCALMEASHIIARGQADVMVVGGLGSRIHQTRLLYRAPGIFDPPVEIGEQGSGSDPQRSKPFQVGRTGIVPAEGAVALVLESRRHAIARNASVLGVLQGTASTFGKPTQPLAGSSSAIAGALAGAMREAGIEAADVGCVSAQGYSGRQLDLTEALAIQKVAPEAVVTATSSYFGTAGAASGLLQLAASLLAAQSNKVLPTLGGGMNDASCGVQLNRELSAMRSRYLAQLNFTPTGHAAAAIVECTN